MVLYICALLVLKGEAGLTQAEVTAVRDPMEITGSLASAGTSAVEQQPGKSVSAKLSPLTVKGYLARSAQW